MDVIWTESPVGRGDRTLLVMLPGARLPLADFARHGFPHTPRAGDDPVDAVAVNLRPGDYLDGDVAGRLHRDVIAPALERGYRRLWLLGISLGGMGALLFARAGLAKVDGLILLAPFLATRGTIAEVTAAGGLAAWEPGRLGPHDIERGLLAWLRSRPFAPGGPPRLLLGYGAADRYAGASRLLAAHMRPERIAVAPSGGYDWATWTALWRTLLGAAPFGALTNGKARD